MEDKLYKVSKSVNGHKGIFEPLEVTWEELIKLVTTSRYSTSVFSDSTRRNANFEFAEIMGLDIDNGEAEEKMTLEQAKKAFADYKHIIATTKSHNRPKNGIIADRFRVLLFLETPITDVLTFKATWNKLLKDYPAIDKQCSDAARYWDPSVSETNSTIIFENKTGALIAPVDPIVPQERNPQQYAGVSKVFKEKNVSLKPATANFLVSGAPDGAWNGTLFNAVMDMRECGYTKDEVIQRVEVVTKLPQFKGHLDEADMATIESAFRREVKNPRDTIFDNNDELKNSLLNSILVTDAVDATNYFFYNTEAMRQEFFDRNNLPKILSQEERKNMKSVLAYMNYEPGNNNVFFRDRRGYLVYNTYEPPFWKRDLFYHGKEIPQGRIPENIDKYLKHFTDGDKESYEYVLDWIATAMRSRNYTVLTAIGNEGVGKGVLFGIMRTIFGDNNSKIVTDRVFKTNFNDQLENKHLVFIDEISLEDKTSYDKFKAIVNDEMEVEGKNRDAKTIENKASYYVASNHYTALKIDNGDRRISAIQIADRSLLEVIPADEVKNLFTEETVKDFAYFLYHRKVTRNMMKPFRSERFNDILEANTKPWVEYLITRFHKEHVGQNVATSYVKDQIAAQLFNHAPPNVNTIEQELRAYPELFEVKKEQNKEPVRRIIVKDKKESGKNGK